MSHVTVDNTGHKFGQSSSTLCAEVYRIDVNVSRPYRNECTLPSAPLKLRVDVNF